MESKVATVSDLHPGVSGDMNFRIQKNSLRYQGSHILKLRRPSRLPAFSRRYIKGDPLKLIDWKVFARTDQLLIREQRDEASANICIRLECTPTMDWPDEETKRISGQDLPKKNEIGIRVALNLCFAHLGEGDRIVFLITEGSWRKNKRVSFKTSSDVLRMFAVMEESGFSVEELMEGGTSWSRARRPFDIVYWISDGLGRMRLEHLARESRYVRFLHTLSSLECRDEWMRPEDCLYDHAVGKKEYTGKILQQDGVYLQKIGRWRDRLRDEMRGLGGAYQLVTDQTPIIDYQDELLIPFQEEQKG